MRILVSEDHKLRRWREADEDLNTSTTGRSERAVQVLEVVERDATRCNGGLESGRLRARITGGCGRFRQGLAVGLRDIENVRCAEADNRLGFAVRGVGIPPRGNRRQDGDALFALANEPS